MCGISEGMIPLIVAGVSAAGKAVGGLLANDNPGPAPIKLTGDQTGVAKTLHSAFTGLQGQPGVYQTDPNQAGYTPIGSLGNELGAPTTGSGYMQRLNALQNHLGGVMGAPMPTGTQGLRG